MMTDTVKVEIKKPLYGNYVYIRKSILDQAINSGVRLEITVPAGKAIVDPREWKKNGQVMKKVFKIPNNPMILYGGNVPIRAPKGEVIHPETKKAKKANEKQATLL